MLACKTYAKNAKLSSVLFFVLTDNFDQICNSNAKQWRFLQVKTDTQIKK